MDSSPIDLGARDGDATDPTSDVEDGTAATEPTEPTDATDTADTADGADASGPSDATDASDGTDATDTADTSTCVTALIEVEEGPTVPPQTVLHLSGASSYSPRGDIVSWQWEVDQPIGSVSTFAPSPYVSDPVFEANVAGVYTFRLTTTDATGVVSCVTAELRVYVVPEQVLHVELLWHTPADADLTDASGADLDVHFIHPLAAPPGYFDIPFDCFWGNTQPNWGALDPAAGDNPTLDRDDTDGDGPENLNFNVPEDGKRYCLAVHYWDDKSFGPSYATVRIYQHGELTFEMSDVAMVKSDLWEVGCIEWPAAVFEPADGAPKITHDFSDPEWLQP